MKLPESLAPGASERAVYLLSRYYRVPELPATGYTGARFDSFDPFGTRSDSTNVFTAEDLVAVTFLSVEVPPRAAHQLLVEDRGRFSELLTALGPDRDFARVVDVSEDGFSEAWNLWRELNTVVGLGPTKVSKLMARKRPRLIPIIDSVVREHVYRGSDSYWVALHETLNANHADGLDLHDYLGQLRREAGLGPEVTALRVFDVLAWMDGNGDSEKLLAARRKS